ncbi:MAG: hypothetical protein NZ700_08385 [Gemmataceae bacterium]|nr:hypothetical protein [Gemmataceae bacterium]MDW8266148.1 hypothetical protein [Gemmataceae bacterium]
MVGLVAPPQGAAKDVSYWLREVAGWCLVGIGLVIFYLCYALLMNRGEVLADGQPVLRDGQPVMTDQPRFLEAAPLTLIGIMVFRGGIHLLKVAVAARVCREAAAAWVTPGAGVGPAGQRRPFTWRPADRR